MTATVDDQRVEVLAATFEGQLLRPGTDGYEEVRLVHNGLVNKRPGLIARCTTAADVAAAIACARAGGHEISVRGGGHNVGGSAVTDGGVMIDLSPMKAITVDADARTLRAEGGVTWAELNDAAAAHGLAVTGGAISSTGVAGYTLGGGLGWLMSMYGLAADNLVSVELVTAAGEVLVASEASNADLFWALRGGGGNFGVATAFEFRMHPLAQIVGGLIAHPFAAAPDVLRFYRELTRDLPDELTVFAGLVHAPDGSGMKLAALVVCHVGSPEQAELDLAPILAYGEPLMVQVGPMPYPEINKMLDDAYPFGSLNYWKSAFTAGLDDGLIDTAIERFTTVPSPMTAMLFEHFHGEVTRIGVSDTAVPHREPGYNLLITSVWTDPAATTENVAWTRESYEALGTHLVARRWLNYLGADEDSDGVRDAYGPNYERLTAAKRRYDPDNIFRLNQNIPPAAG